MPYDKMCKTCGMDFTANRVDAVWCSGKCAAKYYRDHPNPDYIHAEKDHEYFHLCEECGQGYTINGYAERGGKRKPKYCSPACKQKAWRGSAQQQAKRRYDGGKANQQKQSSGSGHKREQDNRQRYSRAEKRDPYVILGVARGASKNEIRKAWKALVLKWHPDKNPDNVAEATARCQDINWAYDQIGR